MVTDSSELPFFPKYETELLHNDKLRIIWFEPHFSQSHYNAHNKSNGSNACTLIAVILASKLNQTKTKISQAKNPINHQLISVLAASMVEGNRIHEMLKIKNILKHINLNVPEAIKYAEKHATGLTEWKGLVYMEPLSLSLFENIKTNWIKWIKSSKRNSGKDVFITLIADSKTVLFYIQSSTDMVVLIDSHQHSPAKGAFVAITQRQSLKSLCSWFSDVLMKCNHCDPEIYELSFLYFKNKEK